jgi:hypothetical protein
MTDMRFTRLQIAGLFLVSFLGLVMHVSMFSFETAVDLSHVAVQTNTEGGRVDMGIITGLGEHLEEMASPAVPLMMFVFVLVSLAAVVLPLLSEVRVIRWLTAILGLLLAAMNTIDGAVHIFKDGDVINGLYTLLISGGIGFVAVVLAFRWARLGPGRSDYQTS